MNTPGVVGIIALQALTSFAVVAYFWRRRHTVSARVATTCALAAVLLTAAAIALALHIDLLTTAEGVTNVLLVGIVPVTFGAAAIAARVLKRPPAGRVRGHRRRARRGQAHPGRRTDRRGAGPVSPDLIVTADTVHTLDPSRPAATAVAITGGTITAVGDRSQVTTWRGAGTRVIELGAATVTPGPSTAISIRCWGWTRPAAPTCPPSATWTSSPPLRRAQRDEPGSGCWAGG